MEGFGEPDLPGTGGVDRDVDPLELKVDGSIEGIGS
jgi:hypothetical protein